MFNLSNCNSVLKNESRWFFSCFSLVKTYKSKSLLHICNDQINVIVGHTCTHTKQFSTNKMYLTNIIKYNLTMLDLWIFSHCFIFIHKFFSGTLHLVIATRIPVNWQASNERERDIYLQKNAG